MTMTQPIFKSILISVCLLVFSPRLRLDEALAQHASSQKPHSSLVWHSLASTDGSFSVSMPGVPTHVVMAAGQHKYSVNIDNHRLFYSMIYGKLGRKITDPEEVRNAFRICIDGELNPLHVVAHTETSLSLQGYPGKEITFQTSVPGGGTRNCLIRIYLVDSTLYELAVNRSGRANEQDTQRFLHSFRLLKPKIKK